MLGRCSGTESKNVDNNVGRFAIFPNREKATPIGHMKSKAKTPSLSVPIESLQKNLFSAYG